MPSEWLKNTRSQQEFQNRQKPWSQPEPRGYQDPWSDEDEGPWGYQESQDQLGGSSSANDVLLAESQAPRYEGQPLNLQDHDQQVLLSDHKHPDGQQFQPQQQSLTHGETQDPGNASCTVPVVAAVEDQAREPDRPPGTHIPVTEDQARNHIKEIRDQKMRSYQSGIAEDFKNALDVISNELYPNPADFLLEILQNADNNTYESSVAPKLWITYWDDMLRFDTNEAGFNRADVDGICGVGRSSKKEKAEATQAGKRQIGEKGIGFKAVYRVADEVFIKSGFYSFKFADKDIPGEMVSLPGRVAPAWAAFPADVREGCTSILLKLRTNINRQRLVEEIMNLDAKFLIFLNKVKEVEMEAFETPSLSSNITRVILCREDSQDDTTGLPSRVLTPDISSPYILFHHPVLQLPPEPKRKGLTESELVLALPHVTTADLALGERGCPALAQTHKAYSFLPIRDYGFKFMLQADFVLVANRKEIDAAREWNKTLHAALPNALLSFVTQLNASGLQYRWPLLFPIRDGEQSFFKGINAEVLEQFSGTDIIESIHGTFEVASKLSLVPPQLANVTGGDNATPAPMIPAAFSQFTYASPGYPATSWASLFSFGVHMLTDQEFLQDLGNFISKHPDEFRAMPKAWHSRDHEKAVASLRFIPLQDGKLVASQDGPLIFPLRATKKNLQIPDRIGQSVVHAEVAEDSAQRKLLLKLGARNNNEQQVCRLIVQAHGSSWFAPETIDQAILMQHTEYLWVVVEDGRTRRRSSHVYLDSTGPASASRVFGEHRGQFSFLHPDYRGKFDTLEHRRFLIAALQMAELPRMVSPGHTPTDFMLSQDFRFLIENLPAIDVLQLVRANWGHYCAWIVSRARMPGKRPVTDGPHERVKAAFACMQVKLPDGRQVRLDQTCLPRKNVLAAFGLVYTPAKGVTSAKGDATIPGTVATATPTPNDTSNAPKLDVLSVPEPDSADWDILEHFNVVVRVEVKDLVRRLGQLRKGSPTKEAVAVVYERIETLVNKIEPPKELQAQFEEQELVFLPKHLPQWVSIKDCVWEAADALKKTPQLKDEYPQQEWLFCKTLNVASSSIETAIDEAKRITSRDPLPYIQELLQHIDLLARKAGPKYNGLDPLRQYRILPIWFEMPGHKFWLSAPAGKGRENEWYIADKPFLRECFQRQTPLLAFDFAGVKGINTLLERLNLDSKLAEQHKSGVGGPARIDKENTAYMQKRARYISCLIPKQKKNRERLTTQLKNVQVSRVAMTVIWQFCNEWGDTVQGRPESVDFMVDAGTDVLKIYIKEGKATLDKPPGKFIRELKTLFGIPDGALDYLLDILIKEDTSDIERDLTREGLLTDETDAPEDAIPDGVVFSTTRPARPCPEDRPIADMPATEEAVDERPGSDPLTFADFFGSDKSRYRYGNDRDDDNHDYDRRVSTSAAGESMADRYENLIREGLREVSKSRRSRGWADVPRPMNPLYDVPGAEESLFIAELWVGSMISSFPLGMADGWSHKTQVHDFLAKIVAVPTDYIPEKHWTSAMRSRAGHKPFEGGSNPKISSFTLIDSSGRLKEFLDRLGHRRVNSLGAGSRFHIQVAFAEGGHNVAFEMPAAQVAMHHAQAEALTFVHSNRKRIYSEVYMLAVVFMVHIQPTLALFVDPWDLKRRGILSLETDSKFQGCFVETPPVLCLGRCAKPEPVPPPRLAIGAPDDDAANHKQQRPRHLYQYRHLRHHEIRLVLLDADSDADAICINQADGHEKALQIRLIGRIFGRAERVVDWLGAEYDGSHEAIETLLRIRRGAAGDEGAAAATAGWWGSVSDDGDVVWKHVDALLRRPWFERAWIVQEVVLASRLALMCGTRDEVGWEEFFEGLVACAQALDRGASGSGDDAARSGSVKRLPYAAPAFALGLARYRMGSKQQGDPKAGLLELLELFAHTQATKEVDKLFGMLGLAGDTASEVFNPDYDSPLEEVVRRYAGAFVANGQAMELLYRAGVTKMYPFCSWIPRWTSGEFPQTISTWAAMGGEFQAGQRVPPPAPAVLKTGCLQVRGFTSDTIQHVSQIPMAGGWALCATSLAAFAEQLKYYADRYPTGETPEDLLVRLPIGNASHPHLDNTADQLRSYRDVTQRDSIVLGFVGDSGGARDGTNAPQYRTVDGATRLAMSDYWRTATAFATRLGGAAFCGTKGRYVGLVPALALPGDRICLLHSGKVPFVLRPLRNRVYQLIGEAYIHGMMHAGKQEAGKQEAGLGLKDEDFVLE
ncbi:hypothetical protein C8A05DRAFT_48025 [Staphylotrichum tortipilum]|uniref:Heterokaryon incompatibility domain-containing protein n=1 Tax=Staphylotrichum tortipilum TaxID=2831512 RepID=A0AAN6MC18_9PEZI|nr:hypothetical protein C8A05DRAFT_48025 [Staphylotrichum longicolle]